MSKYNNSDKKNEKVNEIDLEASNQFTLKGEDDIQYEQSSPKLESNKIHIESNRKSNARSNSRRSIKINNLTNFSFCSSEHRNNSDDVENKENKIEEKKDFEDNFKKINIIQRERKCNTIVKITVTKTKENSSKKKK